MENDRFRISRRCAFLTLAACLSLAVPALLEYTTKHSKTGVIQVARIRDAFHAEVPPYVQWRPNHTLILCRVRRPMGASGGPDGDYSFGKGFFSWNSIPEPITKRRFRHSTC